jgi:N-acyl-D-aspartate/D-glutamate deacylase
VHVEEVFFLHRSMEGDFDIVIKNGNLFLGAKNCDVGIRNGKITALESGIPVNDNMTVIDATNKIVIPGYHY